MTYIVYARLDKHNRKSERVEGVRPMHNLLAQLTASGWQINAIKPVRE